MSQQLVLTERTSPDKTWICKFLHLTKSALWPLLAGSNTPVQSRTTGKFPYQSLLTYNITWEKTTGISTLFSRLRWTRLVPGEIKLNVRAIPQAHSIFTKEFSENEGWKNQGRAAVTHLGTDSALFFSPVKSCSWAPSSICSLTQITFLIETLGNYWSFSTSPRHRTRFSLYSTLLS